jgi:NAD(P)-dependent dehydrogenase (short-subunit alcohol dehydrogenase family)
VNLSSATSKVPEGPPFRVGGRLGATSTMYGATKSALERITAGLAAELFDDGIALNTVAPVAAVRTPGAEAHLGSFLDTPGLVEPVEWLADATLALATCDPKTTTGRVLYSGPFLDEIGWEKRG